MSTTIESKSALMAVANAIATSFFGVMVGMLLAQNMVKKEYGEFSVAYSAVGIIALLSGVGFKSLVTHNLFSWCFSVFNIDNLASASSIHG